MSDEATSEAIEVEAAETEEEEPSFEDALKAATDDPGGSEPPKKADDKPAAKKKAEPKAAEEAEEETFATERERELARDVKGLIGVKVGQRAEIDNLQGQVNAQNERLAQMLNEVRALRQDLIPPEPPKEEEPEEFLERKLGEKIDPLLQAEEERQIAETSTFVTSHTKATREAFVEEHPDYEEAAAWLAQREVAEFRANNPTFTEAEVRQEWEQHCIGLRVHHARNETSMFEGIYGRAVRWGFEASEAEEEGAEPKPKPSKVSEVKKRVAKTKIAPAGRTQSSPELTAEDIANFTQDDWDRELDKEEGFENMLKLAATAR